MTNDKPCHELKVGRVRASIWANDTKHGKRFSVTLGRLYKNDEGKWQTALSLDRDDLLNAAKALDSAHSWVIAQPSENAKSEE